ncbi:MAG: DUF948 domain-containing protein [Syntrophales bacterium]
MSLEVSMTIISLSFLLFAVFFVVYVLKILKTVRHLEETLHVLNQKLPDILSDFQGITANLAATSHILRDKLEGLSIALDRIHRMTDFIESTISPGIGTPLLKTIGNLIAIRKGVSIFLRTLTSKD